jgi:hypothetical protein
MTVAVQQQPLEGGDLSADCLCPDLGLGDPPFHYPATPVDLAALLFTALLCLRALPLAQLGRSLLFSLTLLLGGQPLSLRRRLLPRAFGLLLFPELGLGSAFLLATLLSALLLQLSLDPALFR